MSTSFPHNSIPGVNRGVAEAGWRQFARLYLLSGVVADLDNELEVTADGVSGLQVEVDTGRAWVDGFLLRNDDLSIVELEDADPAEDRLDLIVARYDPEGFSEQPTASGEVAFGVVTGTPNATPVLPSLTEDADGVFEVALASVLVQAAAAQVPPGNVTDQRPFTRQVRDLSGTTAERNALAGQVLEGTFFFDTDLSEMFRWNGTIWQETFTTTFGALADVDVPSPSEGDVVQFDGSQWVAVDIDAELAAAVQDAEDAAAQAEDAAIVFAIALGG